MKMPLISGFAKRGALSKKRRGGDSRSDEIYKDQGPLKDAPGSLPPEVAAQLAERPPTAAAKPRPIASKKWTKTAGRDWERPENGGHLLRIRVAVTAQRRCWGRCDFHCEAALYSGLATIPRDVAFELNELRVGKAVSRSNAHQLLRLR